MTAEGLDQIHKSDNARLTFPFASRDQVLTSFSTLTGAVALRGGFMAHQQGHARATREAAARRKVKASVFGDDATPARAWALRDSNAVCYDRAIAANRAPSE